MSQQRDQCVDGVGGLWVEEQLKARGAGRDRDYPTKQLACFPGVNALLKDFKQGSHVSKYTYFRKITLVMV